MLIVEPDAEARRLYIGLVRPIGCDAIEAADGREALVEALVRRPSVIVMESRLPLVNGPALCEILRRDSLTRTVPILALAADAAELEVDRILQAGATSILIRPVAPTALVSELQRLAAAGNAVSMPAIDAPTARANPSAAAHGTRRKRVASSKMHLRCTTRSPPAPPPALRCPSCDEPLTYERSHLGGVSQRQPEQWTPTSARHPARSSIATARGGFANCRPATDTRFALSMGDSNADAEIRDRARGAIVG